MTSLVLEHGIQGMPCFANFSMTLQIQIPSTESLDFLKQIIILRSFSSMFKEYQVLDGMCQMRMHFVKNDSFMWKGGWM